jgi:hypothetical protein
MIYFIGAVILAVVSTLLISGTSPYQMCDSPTFKQRQRRRLIAIILYIAASLSLVIAIISQFLLVSP